MHRIDSGGAAGAGISLARGENTLTVGFYANTTDLLSAGSGLLILNYTSGKASGGTPKNTHTTHWLSINSDRAWGGFILENQAITPNIPETNYGITDVVIDVLASGFQTSVFNFHLLIENANGEGPGAGWRFIGSAFGDTGNERQIHKFILPVKGQFYRWASDSDSSRMNPETTHTWQFFSSNGSHQALAIWLTHHAMTFTVSGTVSGYSGDGSGITIEVFRSDTGEKIGSTTTSAGGTYSLTVYQNAINLYSTARQDSTHLGRSDNGVAA